MIERIQIEKSPNSKALMSLVHKTNVKDGARKKSLRSSISEIIIYHKRGYHLIERNPLNGQEKLSCYLCNLWFTVDSAKKYGVEYKVRPYF
jgi:hypothetical protein